MIMLRWAAGMAAICLSFAAMTGCSRSPRVNFYTLATETRTEAAATGKNGYSVAIGPVTLPEMVDRPQLVVRAGANRVDILEAQRWAEPLKHEIPRLVAENLSSILGSERITSYPQSAGIDADYRVLLDIQRFESSPGKTVTVEALWTIRRASGETVTRGRSLVNESVGSEGYDAIVAAYSRALTTVSSDIARAIRGESAASH